MNNKPRLIFFGNTKYSLIGAKIIHEKLGLTAVATIEQSPVAAFAKEQNIPLIITNKLTATIIEGIKNFQPDFLIVEDYGLILPQTLLDVPKFAPLNIHHSLLPKYRGPSPAPSAILAGEKVSGVSIIRMTNDVDAGDILAQKEYALQEDETTDSLLAKLNAIGAPLAVEVINEFLNNRQHPVSQDNTNATYTEYMEKSHGYIDSNNPPNKEQLDRMIRAYFPWPGVWTKMNVGGKEKIVKLLPNQQLQVEGKKPMSIKDFINGYPNAKEIIEKLMYLEE